MTFTGKPATNDLVVWDGTKFVQTPNVVLNQNASPGPSAANTGRIHFDTTAQQVMISENGSAVHSISLVHPTISDLRSRTPQANSNVVTHVAGYSAAGDGGGGLFTWVTTGSPPADNGGTIITPTGTPGGYWKRIPTGTGTNVKWFGAKGDNVTNDITAITNAIAAVRVQGVFGLGGGTVFFPNGIYRVGTPIMLYDGIQLIGENPGTPNGFASAIATLNPGWSGDALIRCAVRNLAGVYGCAIKNLNLSTNFDNISILDMSGLRSAEISNLTISGPSLGFGSAITGLLYSDFDGGSGPENLATTFFNKITNLFIFRCNYGIKIHCGSGGFTSDAHFDVFAISECNFCLRLESNNVGLGCTFTNGYLFSPFQSLISYVGSGVEFIACTFIGMELDSAGAPASDLAASEGLTVLGIQEPSAGFINLHGFNAAKGMRNIIEGNEINQTGSSSLIPLTPNSPRGCSSLSFWACIPRGTMLVPGANSFIYHSRIGIDPSNVGTSYYGLRDLAFKFNILKDGGLNVPFSFSGSNSKTIPSWDGVNGWNTYTVKLYLDGYNTSSYTLASDLVFFIEASQTAYISNSYRIGSAFEDPAAANHSDGIIYDWNADTAANSGGVVTSWTDGISSLVLTPPTTPSRPTYLTNQINGHASVQSDGSSMYMTSTTFAMPTPFEYWFVMKQISPYINGSVIVNDAVLDHNMFWTRGGSPDLQVYSDAGLFTETNGDLAMDTWGIVRVRWVGPSSEIQVGSNQSTRGFDPGSIGITNGITLFRRNSTTPGQYSHVAVSRLLIVDLKKGNYNPDAILSSLQTTYAL